MAAPSERSGKLHHLPAEVLQNIICALLWPRTIQVTVQSFKNGVVTAKPDFNLSTTLVCKSLRAATNDQLNKGIILCLDSPFAMLHLASVFPDVIRSRVRFLELKWQCAEECDDGEHHGQYKPQGGYITENLESLLPSIEGVLLESTFSAVACEILEATDEDEAWQVIESDFEDYVNDYIDEHGSIELAQFDKLKRDIPVHINVRFRSSYELSDDYVNNVYVSSGSFNRTTSDWFQVLVTYWPETGTWTHIEVPDGHILALIEYDGTTVWK